jgi:tetratricopeptide (TPR) repeat protein
LTLAGDKAIRNYSAWEALAFYKRALAVFEHHLQDGEQKQNQLKTLHAMMSPIIILNFPEGSLGLLEMGAALAKELDDQKSLIRFYSNMGFFHSVKGRHREGIRFSGKAFAEATAINDLTAMAQAAPDICLSHFSTGHFKKVIEITSKMIHAIHKAEREQDNFGGPAVIYPAFYALSGSSLAHLGRFDEAMSNCLYGRDLALESENTFTIGLCRFHAGTALLLKGAWDDASAYFMSCLEGLKSVDLVEIEALAKAGLGVAKAFTQDPISGRALAEAGLKAFQGAGRRGLVSTLHCYVGICCYASGDVEDARLSMAKSLASAIENDESYFKGRALIWQGRIVGKSPGDDTSEAIRQIKKGLKILTALDTTPDVATAHLFLGEVYARRGQEAAAKGHLKKAAALFTEMGMDYWMEETGRVMKQFE